MISAARPKIRRAKAPRSAPLPPPEPPAVDLVAQEIRTRILPVIRPLAQRAQAAGKVSFRWTVLPDGSVQRVQVVDSNVSQRLVQQIATLISRWRFPQAPQGETREVTYPFVFAGSDGGYSLGAVDNIRTLTYIGVGVGALTAGVVVGYLIGRP